MKWLPVPMMVFALTLCAADVAGTWKATLETPKGSLENTFVFKTDGAKLFGTLSNELLGEVPISDGKVDGDNLSFNITALRDGNEYKVMYKGKMDGKEMKLTMTFPGGTMDLTAKKVG